MSAAPAEDIQALGRQMLLGLYMLSKSVKIYSTDNAIFLKPLQGLVEQVNRVVAAERRCDLLMVGPALYVNGRLIRIDQASLENVKQLAHAFKGQGLGGFSLPVPTSLDELKNFFLVFTADTKDELPEDGLPGHKLPNMRLKRWAAHQERNQEEVVIADAGKLRTRRAMAVYARAVIWATYQTRCAKEGRADDAVSAAIRIAQDVVDVTFDLKEELLPLLVNGDGDRVLAFHLVNTAFLATTFGMRLGLSKVALKDLSIAALTNETYLAKLPPSCWLPADPDRLSQDQQSSREAVWREAAQAALGPRAGSRLNQVRALSVVEMHRPYLVPVKDASGKVEQKPGGDYLFTSRVLAIAAHYDLLTTPSGDRPAYGPDQALGALWGPLRQRFDPELLWVFVRTMAPLPLKMMPRRVGGIVGQ